MNKTIFEKKTIGEKCLKTVLDNGLEIYLSEKPNFDSSYAVFGTKYGSCDTIFSTNLSETITVPEGIAHYLEHKLFEGEDGDAFEKFAVTGASANAYTSFDRTCYLFSCSQNFYKNLEILLDFVSTPFFTEQTVSKEQGIIAQEIKMYKDDPNWCVFFNLLKEMYVNHPARIEIAGTVESIAKITPELLYSCYETFYNPSNMFVCLCGNFESEKVIEIIKNKITTDGGKKIVRTILPEPTKTAGSSTTAIMPTAIPLFSIGIKDLTEAADINIKEKVICELLALMISSKVSPIYNQLLNDGLVDTQFYGQSFSGQGISTLIFEGQSNDPEAVKTKIVKALQNIANGEVDQQAFNAIKRKKYGSQVHGFNQPESIVANFVNCAVEGCEPFEDIDCVAKIEISDLVCKAKNLDLNKTFISVIKNQ